MKKTCNRKSNVYKLITMKEAANESRHCLRKEESHSTMLYIIQKDNFRAEALS